MSTRNSALKRKKTSEAELHEAAKTYEVELPYYATDAPTQELPDDIPQHGYPAKFVNRWIKDQHTLDFSQLLNTSSYVNVVFEKEEEDIARLGMRINLADQTVYTQSFDLHNRTLAMVANLFNCPKPSDYEENGTYPGACTVGSTEACLLSALALKFRWRKWYQKFSGKTKSEVRGTLPNMVISTQYQAAWEKLFKYFDVEPKFIVPSYKSAKLEADKVIEAIDEKTMGVVCIMGNHYGGQYDPVWEINDAIEKVNKEKGYQVGIHVDAASGGFIAPFQKNVPAWDFRLKNVLAISTSGHKFGESVCGTGWVVFRQREDLSEHIAISVSYLGGSGESYTLNFSRPATGVYVQFYKFFRLGIKGYTNLCNNMMGSAKYIRDEFKLMKAGNGKKIFEILDDGDDNCLPVVTARVDPNANVPWDDIDLQHVLSMSHWYVSGYHMDFEDPVENDKRYPLYRDCSPESTMFRIVVKSNLTKPMAVALVKATKEAIKFLDDHGSGFKKVHKNQTKQKGHCAC